MDRRTRTDDWIAAGRIVAPGGATLVPAENGWIAADEPFRRATTGAPILLSGPGYEEYATASKGMTEEYATPEEAAGRSLPRRLFDAIDGPFTRLVDATTPRSAGARAAFARTMAGMGAEHLCVAIGGGPLRDHEELLNLNIGPFPNVEIVADAHRLPFADGAVDRFSMEAVLEHLEDPELAVAEAFRCLRPGGMAFACTPFLQAYHGYPHHYRGFTLTGQESLFRRGGFEVLDYGAAIGPVTMLVDLAAVFPQTYAPKGLNVLGHRLTLLLGIPFRYLDLLLFRSPHAHVMASGTYVLARKPE